MGNMMNASTQGHTADLVLDPVENQWKATFRGQILARSKNRQYIIDTIQRGMNKTANACGVVHVRELTNSTIGELLRQTDFEMPNRPEFSIQERFDFLQNLSQMAIEGSANAVLVTGEGGLGKSFTVVSEIKRSGLTLTSDFSAPPKADVKKTTAKDDDDGDGDGDDIDDIEEVEWVNPGQCHIVKGFSSAKGLYRTLYEMNGKLIVFDDCDSIQRNTDAVNILKGALDSSDERWISWNAEEGRNASGLPRQFQFTGRVIFISNWSQARIDPNLKTRCMRVDLTMTAPEKIERMKHIIDQVTFQPNVSMEVKEDAIRFLEEHKDIASNLSLRTLLDTIKFRNKNLHNWERQALYSLTA
jgi:hypothetical protein